MPRTIWTKLQSDPNGTWMRHEGEPPFSIPATGGQTYDLVTDTGESFSVTPLIAGSAPVISGQPTILGLAEVGQTLTASAASSTGTAPISTSWQWLRDGVEISGATASSFTLSETDQGSAISVRQTDSNAQGSDSAISAALTVQSFSAPVINGQPTILGLAEVGQTLTASAASSTGTAPISTSWQWLRDGVEISGATASSFSLSETDQGSAISVRQTDSNAQGTDSAISAALIVQGSSGAVAIISSLLVTSQSATGEVALAFSIDRDSAVAGVLTRTATAPSASQILAGQDASGAAAASSFSDVWTTGGNDSLTSIALGLAADTYYLHVLPSGGGNPDVVTSNGFQLETVAPVILTAQTSEAGQRIELDFSETLAGTSDASDWTLTADGVAQTITAVTMTDAHVSLFLSTLLTDSQTLRLSYGGNALTDTVANPVAIFSNLTVENSVSAWTENTVTVPAGAALVSADPLPSDARSLLFFASLAQDAALDARAALATWNGTAGGFHSDYTSGNALGGIRLRLQGGGASIPQGIELVPIGTRYHVLVSGWFDDTTGMNVNAWLFDTTAGSWSEVASVSDPAAPGSTFELGPDPLKLFVRSDGNSQPFTGTVNRIALWAAPQSTPIADISDPTVRDLFADATGMKPPAFSQVDLGLALMDFAGTAEDYNAGAHSGTLAAFLPTSTFS